jgi:hypothetical protein
LHFVSLVCALVMQHVTNPRDCFPQVERAAQRFTAPLQLGGSDGVSPLDKAFAS